MHDRSGVGYGDWYWQNYIESIGCNIVGFSNIGDVEDLKKTICSVVQHDENYGQLGLIQVGHYSKFWIEGFKNEFSQYILHEMDVTGGHGNRDCVLFLIDLRPFRDMPEVKYLGGNDA